MSSMAESVGKQSLSALTEGQHTENNISSRGRRSRNRPSTTNIIEDTKTRTQRKHKLPQQEQTSKPGPSNDKRRRTVDNLKTEEKDRFSPIAFRTRSRTVSKEINFSASTSNTRTKNNSSHDNKPSTSSSSSSATSRNNRRKSTVKSDKSDSNKSIVELVEVKKEPIEYDDASTEEDDDQDKEEYSSRNSLNISGVSVASTSNNTTPSISPTSRSITKRNKRGRLSLKNILLGSSPEAADIINIARQKQALRSANNSLYSRSLVVKLEDISGSSSSRSLRSSTATSSSGKYFFINY